MKKNIAIVISSLGGGGTQQFVSSLSQRLIQENINLYIYQLDYIETHIVIKGAKLRDLRSTKKGLMRNYDLIFSINYFSKLDSIDTVISFLPKTNILCILSSLFSNYKLIICERNDPLRQPQPLLVKTLRRLTYFLADEITANTSFAVRILKSWYPSKRITYTPNCIRNDFINHASQKTNSFIKKEKSILSVGRFSHQKNFKEIISAFSLLKNNDFHLYLIGEGPEENKLRRLAYKLGVSNQISFVPFNNDIYTWMSQSTLFVLPSLYEGSPNVLWEAAFLNLPIVVSSNVEGALDVLQDKNSMLTYKSGDVIALAECIQNLINNSELRSHISKQAKDSITLYDKGNNLSIWLDLI